ncbi:response regulator [Methylobacterium sp. 17Sr1-1]|nr:response regulator [Methylobacterium sp. 17Sr1-1]
MVDDDALVRMTAADILEDAGFQTLEASTGDEAIALLAEKHATIALLFTDVQMPGSRDGYAVARETADLWSHISIVVASGRAYPAPGDMPDGAVFINKPFSAKVVRAHLNEILPDGQKPQLLRED